MNFLAEVFFTRNNISIFLKMDTVQMPYLAVRKITGELPLLTLKAIALILPFLQQ